MDAITITAPGVEKLLQGLNPAKAAGPDDTYWSPRILKEFSHGLSPTLTTIFQRSLSTGEVPGDWREALVTPVYKKGEHYNLANYHPVSLTSAPCKVMEHVIPFFYLLNPMYPPPSLSMCYIYTSCLYNPYKHFLLGVAEARQAKQWRNAWKGKGTKDGREKERISSLKCMDIYINLNSPPKTEKWTSYIHAVTE